MSGQDAGCICNLGIAGVCHAHTDVNSTANKHFNTFYDVALHAQAAQPADQQQHYSVCHNM